jgi:hypothetical protein
MEWFRVPNAVNGAATYTFVGYSEVEHTATLLQHYLGPTKSDISMPRFTRWLWLSCSLV